jgi:hypothetical protein
MMLFPAAQAAQRDEGNPVAAVALGLHETETAVNRLANRRLGLGSPGEGMAGPRPT